MHSGLAFQIMCLGTLILAAYFGGKVSRRLNLGEVVGQLIGGVLVGPYFLMLLGIIKETGKSQHPYFNAFDHFHFFTFVFLGVIAFSIGEEMFVERLKKVGKAAFVICLVQAIITFACTSAVFLILGKSWGFSLLIGSIGIATAPAATFAIMNKLKLEGKLRHVLGNIVVMADVLEIILFSFFAQIALAAKNGGEAGISETLPPVFKDIGFAVLIGIGVFAVLKLTIRHKTAIKDEADVAQGDDFGFLSHIFVEKPSASVEVLFIIVGFVSLGVGVALNFHLPFLMVAIVAGVLIANFHTHVLFQSLKIENVVPFFNLLFFALIGASVRLDTIHTDTLGMVLAYILARSVGKFFGTWFGARLTGQDIKLRRTLPLLMLPQAGVAAVEAYYLAVILGETGNQIVTIILPSLLFFEIVGITLSERTLIKWQSWAIGEEAIFRGRRRDVAIDQIMLGNFVGAEDIKIPLVSDTKESAIRELVMVLHANGKLPQPDAITREILHRERLASTGLGDGIAVPHCRIEGISEPLCAIGIMEEGKSVDYRSLDNNPVDVLFLIISPAEDPAIHLKMLAQISLLMKEPQHRLAFKKLKRAKEVLAFLHNAHRA